MTKENIRLLLDACFVAKRITETMQELPKGMKPRHIHVIECIFGINEQASQVRVSDVRDRLGITMPSITKLINELEEQGAVTKHTVQDDKRVTLLGLTELGQRYYNQYVERYHTDWAKNLSDVTEEQVGIAIEVIEKLMNAMPKGGPYAG